MAWNDKETVIMPHPSTTHVVADMRRVDLLNAVERERQTSGVSRPDPLWRPFIFRYLALVATALWFRG
jgi:hypothetical protein